MIEAGDLRSPGPLKRRILVSTVLGKLRRQLPVKTKYARPPLGLEPRLRSPVHVVDALRKGDFGSASPMG